MTANRTTSLRVPGAGLRAFVAAVEGFTPLSCVSTRTILIVTAGAFSAGAGLAPAVTAYRTAKQSGIAADGPRGE